MVDIDGKVRFSPDAVHKCPVAYQERCCLVCGAIFYTRIRNNNIKCCSKHCTNENRRKISQTANKRLLERDPGYHVRYRARRKDDNPPPPRRGLK